jgi:hypothetical protein
MGLSNSIQPGYFCPPLLPRVTLIANKTVYYKRFLFILIDLKQQQLLRHGHQVLN